MIAYKSSSGVGYPPTHESDHRTDDRQYMWRVARHAVPSRIAREYGHARLSEVLYTAI